MAGQSNRSRIDEALGLVSKALNPFIAKTLAHITPAGEDWTFVMYERDRLSGKSGFTYDADDVALQLKVLSIRFGDRGFLFDDVLSRADKNFAGELSSIRNEWAHSQNKAYTPDETYRALDTAERFLRAINAIAEADAVRKSKQDVQRAAYADETKRDMRAHVAMPGLAAQDLKPWREVLQPHADIAANDFARAEFAADLFQVANGSEADRGYNNPVEFFARTYITEGLEQLLTIAARRAAGDMNADPVVNLQTTFGGGKTHSMLAVWHLLSGTPLTGFSQSLQEVFAKNNVDTSAIGQQVSRVAIVGNEISPGQASLKADGTQVNTLWGELAWQLGGSAGYARVAEADQTGSVPPGDVLRALITDHAPAVILIDEWVAYARGLYGEDKLAGGTFETQFTFAQQLTEAVKSVPGALLLVSIPASDIRADESGVTDLEVGGAHGREALDRLQNVVSRIAKRWTPASSVESFEIVKRRLFREPDAEARRQIDVTVQAFVQYYQSNLGELPTITKDASYGQRIREAYPIHPELFDRLYGDWSTLDKFQRTRGVLRLMSAVVHALYSAGDDSPLIMPGSIPLDVPAVRDEITGYLDDAWKVIVETDIDGENATSVQIDREKPLFGTRALTRRIARATFMGSAATLNTSHKGIERKSVFLGVAMPGDTIGNFGSSLSLLGDRASYLYSDSDRFWFDRQPSLNRKATERAQSYSIDDIYEQVITRLKHEPKSTPQFKDVVIAPDDSSDVADVEWSRLVLAHPRYTHDGKGKGSTARSFTEELVKNRGAAPRNNANTIVVLAADEQRWAELESAMRTYLAWKWIRDSKADFDLTQSQIDDATKRAETLDGIVKQRIRETWVWSFYPEQVAGQPLTISALKVDGATDSVVSHASDKLGKQDIVLVQTSPQLIFIALGSALRAAWNDGRIGVGQLWEYYLKYPYMSRLRDKQVLLNAIASVMTDPTWESAGFALAEGYDSTIGDFTGLFVPFEGGSPAIADTMLLVKPELARAQFERKTLEAEAEVSSPDASQGTVASASTSAPAVAPKPDVTTIANARYSGVIDLNADTEIGAQLQQLAAEVLAHLQNASPDTFEVRLMIDAEKAAGFGPGVARTVNENAKTLGFSKTGFEDVTS
ncbi:MAG: DUF499 domain-containing protein [Microbacteriaceae bacterium]